MNEEQVYEDQLDAWRDDYLDQSATIRRFRITLEVTVHSLDDRTGFGDRLERIATTRDFDRELQYDIESGFADGVLWVQKIAAIDYLGETADEPDDAPYVTSTYEPTPVVPGR